MAKRSVSADEKAAIRALGRKVLDRLQPMAEVELSPEVVERLRAEVRKGGFDPRFEAVLFNSGLRIARVFHRYDQE